MDDITNEQERSPEKIEKQPWQMTKTEYEAKFQRPEAIRLSREISLSTKAQLRSHSIVDLKFLKKF
ncbi:MAG: hypothetical protein IPM97_08500 [Bdellovibrionaceae bacterium]|nr:hypothetical protein [Pseudobdellovibrionaceae bacterium]